MKEKNEKYRHTIEKLVKSLNKHLCKHWGDATIIPIPECEECEKQELCDQLDKLINSYEILSIRR